LSIYWEGSHTQIGVHIKDVAAGSLLVLLPGVHTDPEDQKHITLAEVAFAERFRSTVEHLEEFIDVPPRKTRWSNSSDTTK
jgi:hypothetical protein